VSKKNVYDKDVPEETKGERWASFRDVLEIADSRDKNSSFVTPSAGIQRRTFMPLAELDAVSGPISTGPSRHRLSPRCLVEITPSPEQ
jgi:hypothetical protein